MGIRKGCDDSSFGKENARSIIVHRKRRFNLCLNTEGKGVRYLKTWKCVFVLFSFASFCAPSCALLLIPFPPIGVRILRKASF